MLQKSPSKKSDHLYNEPRCRTEGGSDDEGLQKCWEELIKGQQESDSEEGIYPPVQFKYQEDEKNEDEDEEFDKTNKIMNSFFKKSKASIINKDLVNVFDDGSDDDHHDEDLDDLAISEKYRNETLKLSNHKSTAPKTILSIQEKYRNDDNDDARQTFASQFSEDEVSLGAKSSTNLNSGTVTKYSYMPQSRPLQSPTNSSVFLRNKGAMFSQNILTPTNSSNTSRFTGSFTPQTSTHRNFQTPTMISNNSSSKLINFNTNNYSAQSTPISHQNKTKQGSNIATFKKDLSIITQPTFEKRSPIKADLPVSGSFARPTEGVYNVEVTRQSTEDPIYSQTNSNLQSPRYKFLGGLNCNSNQNKMLDILSNNLDEVIVDPPRLYNKESMTSKNFNENEFRELSMSDVGKMEHHIKKLVKYTNKQHLFTKGKSSNEEDIVTNESPLDKSPYKPRKVKHERMKSLEFVNKKGSGDQGNGQKGQ
jgi:hypothetical protein